MSRGAPPDHRLPSLLTRLVDQDPDRQRESVGAWTLSVSEYRAAVKRDIQYLLSTTRRWSPEEMVGLPQVLRSVLNYGIPPLAGRSVAGHATIEDVEQGILRALRDHEPRLSPHSLTVREIEPDDSSPYAIRFEIRGELLGPERPVSMLLTTSLDLESGRCRVQPVVSESERYG